MPASSPHALVELNRQIAAAGPRVAGATQPVFGEGPLAAVMAFVGEQPGDEEDRAGKPFVGPAGRLLDRALAEVGIDRAAVYVTNAVKHFKFVQRGKRRIHQKPNAGDISHYRGWLMQELHLVHPRIVVALGATAVHALTGKALPIIRHRGPATFDNLRGYITVHPSYLLRIPDQDGRHAAYGSFLDDLRRIRQLAADASSPVGAEAGKISEATSQRVQ
jgi:DNA polymerase